MSDDGNVPSDGKIGQQRTDKMRPADPENRIRGLIRDQLYGVLCTQSNAQPYGSMVAFAFSDDLKYIVFGTPRNTNKYRFLTDCRNVAFVVNNMNRHADDLMKVEAVTATGRAIELPPGGADAGWADLLLQRHMNLKAFITSTSTALFKIEISRFFYVSSFQEVLEWEP